MIAKTVAQFDFIDSKYLDGGLVRLNIDGKWVGAVCDHWKDNSVSVSFVTVGEKNESIKLLRDKIDVESVSFRPRYIWHEGEVFVVRMKGVEGTARSVQVKNLIFTKPVAEWLRGTKGIEVPSYDVRSRGKGLSIWNQVLNHYFCPLAKAVYKLKSQKSGEVIVSPDYMVSTALDGKNDAWLWNVHCPVAAIRKKQIIVRPEFHGEIQDFLNADKDKDWTLVQYE